MITKTPVVTQTYLFDDDGGEGYIDMLAWLLEKPETRSLRYCGLNGEQYTMTAKKDANGAYSKLIHENAVTVTDNIGKQELPFSWYFDNGVFNEKRFSEQFELCDFVGNEVVTLRTPETVVAKIATE